MKRLLSFEEFVNEHYEAPVQGQENIEEAAADTFDPAKTTDTDVVVATPATLADLKPGKEYTLTVDGEEKGDMMFQGVTDGVYIFNSEDQKTVLDFNEEEMTKIVSAGGAKEVKL
jgi:hypothetical protein